MSIKNKPGGVLIDRNNVTELENALLSLNRIAAANIVKKEFNGDNAFELVQMIIAPTLEKIGARWESGEIALSQEYMASKICEEIMESILPAESPDRKNTPVIGITTLGDEHMLGKRIVSSFIKANGFNIHDYGNIGPAEVSEKVKEDGIEVLMVSTLMLNLALNIKNLRNIFDREGIKAKIIVGGAPFLFDRDLWKEVGADAMAVDATESLNKIYDVLGLSQ